MKKFCRHCRCEKELEAFPEGLAKCRECAAKSARAAAEGKAFIRRLRSDKLLAERPRAHGAANEGGGVDIDRIYLTLGLMTPAELQDARACTIARSLTRRRI